MGLFVSTIINKIDAKGRVSVPAEFRAAIAQQGGTERGGVYVYPALDKKAIEGGGIAWRDELGFILEQFGPFTHEREVLNTAFFASGDFLPFDNEGRVMFPPKMLSDIGIDKELCFVGLGERFQIWEPQAFHNDTQDLREKAGALLRGLPSPAKIRRGEA